MSVKRIGKNFELNHNMLYPSLRRFESMRAITKKVHTQVGKPNRNMYDITETGEEIFSEMLREFPEKLATNNIEFLVRIALFEKLDYEARKEVLTIRQDILHKQLTTTQSLMLVHLLLQKSLNLVNHVSNMNCSGLHHL